MKTRAHTNVLHNQCLALQTIAILMHHSGIQRDARGVWIYEHAARHVLPALYEGCYEPSIPPRGMRYEPKVMIADSIADDDTLPEASP